MRLQAYLNDLGSLFHKLSFNHMHVVFSGLCSRVLGGLLPVLLWGGAGCPLTPIVAIDPFQFVMFGRRATLVFCLLFCVIYSQFPDLSGKLAVWGSFVTSEVCGISVGTGCKPVSQRAENLLSLNNLS